LGSKTSTISPAFPALEEYGRRSMSTTRGWKERNSYLLHARMLDMEMSPDSLEAGGVNEMSVVVAVDDD
jgi:hypothetical protein